MYKHILVVIKENLILYILSLMIYVGIAIGGWYFLYDLKEDKVRDQLEIMYCAELDGDKFSCWHCGSDFARRKTLICSTCNWNICAYCGACADPQFGGCKAYKERTSGISSNMTDIKWKQRKDAVIENVGLPTKTSFIWTVIVAIIISVVILSSDIKTRLRGKGILIQK